jgi:hypothetical protein
MRAALAAAIAVTFALILSTTAGAATITVNSLANTGTAGICVLRNAITAANTMTATNGCAAGTGKDTIQFSLTGTIPLASTLPQVIDSQLTINGPPSPGITIDGGNAVQVMHVASGATVNLNSLTIANGAGPFGAGGGIDNFGTLTVTHSTFFGNSALSGGGIENDTGGTLTITNSTFSGNSSIFGGGGILNDTGTGSCRLKNTILEASSGGDCGGVGSFIDAGYNIADDSTCNFSATGSHNNTDPKLDPAGLGNNGGPTQTIALLAGSPAIDAIR